MLKILFMNIRDKKIIVCIMTLFLSFSLTLSEGHTFTRLSRPDNNSWLFWPSSSRPVEFYVNLSLPGYTTVEQVLVARRAAEAWNGHPADFAYTYREFPFGVTPDRTYATFNFTNTIMSISDGAPRTDTMGNTSYGCYSELGGILRNYGFTLNFSRLDGTLVDSVVVICQNNVGWNYSTLTTDVIPRVWYVGTGMPPPSQMDLWSVVAHELGHMLGLGHSTINFADPIVELREATMVSSGVPGTIQLRDINSDDIAGLREIYRPASRIILCPLTGPTCLADAPCLDPDCDGLPNDQEALILTDPRNPDTDDDRLGDGAEVNTHRTNPLRPDTDSDGLTDGEEVLSYHCDPRITDTDGDGISDLLEVRNALNCRDRNDAATDYDGDGLTNADEIRRGTLIENADSDGDGMEDGVEVRNGLNPMDPSDARSDLDGDGLSNIIEISIGTNIRIPDTDSDGLTDGAEVNTHRTNPLRPDTDGDGLNDGAEVNTHHTDPLRPDTDGDTLSDGDEVNRHRTNPLDRNTDHDCLDDNVEVAMGTDPNRYQAPEIRLEPGSLDFGDVTRRAKMLYYVIRNRGELPLQIQSSVLTGENFTSETFSPITIAPSGERRFPVVFSPATIGHREGRVRFESNDCFHNPVLLSLSASGQVASLSLTPDTLRFEPLALMIHATQGIRINNSGNKPLKIMLSTNEPAFYPARLTEEIRAGATVEMPIYFRPYRYGSIEGKLIIDGFFGQNTQHVEIPLTGFGAGESPSLATSGSSIDFGETTTGIPVIREVIVSNTGRSRLYVHQVEVIGEDGNSLDATLSHDRRRVLPLLERFTVAPRSERRLRVRFQPTVSGSLRGQLRLKANLPPGEGIHTISFEGRGR